MTTIPTADWLISVDDHVIEPPNVWLDRLPKRYHDQAPRMAAGDRGAVWQYEDKRVATAGLSVAVGKDKADFSLDPVSFDEMRPGAYDPIARIADMNQAGILASLGFPSFPRFCGQIFWEAKDKELAMLCVKAYNDWMIEEWCAAAPGRYIPLTLIPLWDPRAAAEEIERCAAIGARAFAFSENPEPLGLPTIHDRDRYWDPVMAAAQDTEMVVCMHVGSSSTMPSISSDAPALANLTFGAVRAAGTMLAWIFSDYFERMPGLKIALSEGNIGWMPYFIERAEQVIDKQRYWASKTNVKIYGGDSGSANIAPVPQADLFKLDVRQVMRDHIFGCFIEETSGLRCLDIIGEDNVMVEVDYPHSDTTWPDSIEVVHRLTKDLTPEVRRKILRGNAERLFRFTPIEPQLDVTGSRPTA
ncbi:MAG TPA: amidohydrolase family protein [Ilumatobacteraceae bacterium]|nr:amidohydrolase family protein [Ilumatobacteraceae bacterium]